MARLLTLDDHLGEGLSRAHPVGDLASVSAGIFKTHWPQAQHIIPGGGPLGQAAAYAAPLESQWGCPVRQALELNAFSDPY